MHVVTKYDIGQRVYHVVSGEEGIITSILFNQNGYTEYRIAWGFAAYGFVSESEITDKKVMIF